MLERVSYKEIRFFVFNSSINLVDSKRKECRGEGNV